MSRLLNLVSKRSWVQPIFTKTALRGCMSSGKIPGKVMSRLVIRKAHRNPPYWRN